MVKTELTLSRVMLGRTRKEILCGKSIKSQRIRVVGVPFEPCTTIDLEIGIDRLPAGFVSKVLLVRKEGLGSIEISAQWRATCEMWNFSMDG